MADEAERPRRRRTTPVDPRLSPETLRRITEARSTDDPERPETMRTSSDEDH